MRFLRLGYAGMRGVVGAGLTPHNAIRFAAAMGTWVEGGSVAVGMDSRISSPMLKAACLSGLQSCGCRIVDASICPAPVLHHLVMKEKLDGALMLGAGHHQAGWNAIVPLSGRGSCLSPSQSQELLDIYHSRVFSRASWDSIGKIEDAPDGLFDSYLDMLQSIVDRDGIAKRRFRVVADFCNGSGSVMWNSFAKRFGIDIVPLNNIISGFLPHDPEPRPRSSLQIKSIMKPLKADIGFVFNSDMSRSAIVTDVGETLSEEYSFPIVADHVLSKSPPESAVVSNCCTTRTLDEVVAARGGVLYKAKVGQSHTIDKMFETSAVLAGDGSGSVAVSAGVPGFDSFALMILVLESMAASGLKSSEIAEKLPRYEIIKRSVPCPSAHAYSVLRSLRGSFPDAALSEDDGLRFDWKDGWVHLRASMTEPIVRMIVEWKGREEAEDMAMRISSMIERLVSS